MDQLQAKIEQLKMQVEYLQQEKKNLESKLQSQTIELKYALFDAEAANREASYYKKLVNDKNNGK